MGNPVLSIGIIFKNEIRCMERCLKSLQPLRDAIPCELVMADTGSDDGSREVAEQYADILFDFPWVNDFAAARNAVQDRCTGRWYFSVDCDEFLDPDVTQLVHFLQGQARPQDTAGVVLVRNYMTEGMNEDYTDFQAGRLLRLSTGARWTGAIHERWEPKGKKPLRWIRLFKTILYHDGYIGFSGARGETKRQRNVVLLREELEKAPDNLQRLNQFIESGDQQPDLEEKIRHAVDMVKQKGPGWEKLGASILRHGVVFAGRNGLVSSRQEWTRFAQDWFPDSYFTRIDITALSFLHAMQDGEDYAAAVQLGEKYLQAFDDLQTDAIKSDLTVGSLFYSLPSAHRQLKTLLVTAYQKEKQWEKGLQLISELVVSPLNTDEISRTLQGLLEIQEKTQLDTSATIISFWEQLDKSTAEQSRLNLEPPIPARHCIAVGKYCALSETVTFMINLDHDFTAIAQGDPQAELGKHQAKDSYVTLQAGEDWDERVLFQRADYFVTTRAQQTIARSCLADRYGVKILYGTDTQLFPAGL